MNSFFHIVLWALGLKKYVQTNCKLKKNSRSNWNYKCIPRILGYWILNSSKRKVINLEPIIMIIPVIYTHTTWHLHLQQTLMPSLTSAKPASLGVWFCCVFDPYSDFTALGDLLAILRDFRGDVIRLLSLRGLLGDCWSRPHRSSINCLQIFNTFEIKSV